MTDKLYPSISEHQFLGAALGNARASGLDLDDLILAWYDSSTLEEFDIAVDALGTLRMIEKGER